MIRHTKTRIFILPILFLIWSFQGLAQSSFLVAGHAYGAHSGTNIGFHPPFIKKMNELNDTSSFALFLTGDLVNQSTKESWNQVLSELREMNMPSYLIMGNHDINQIGQSVFDSLYQSTYYSFVHHGNLFIVLNSTLKDRSISNDQIEFLTNVLNENQQLTNRIFIFFHEVLWNSHPRYADVRSNSRSRYDRIRNSSNFWTEVFPLLKGEKQTFIITGDVAGNSDAIPAFYDTVENLTLISSGMGEVEEENFLKVNYNHDSVWFNLIGLKPSVSLKPLSFYSIPLAPDSIYGNSRPTTTDTTLRYWIKPESYQMEYEWKLSDGLSGTSKTSEIDVWLNETTSTEEVQVKTIHDGFGSSEWKSLILQFSESVSSKMYRQKGNSYFWYTDQNTLFIELGEGTELVQIYTLTGKLVYKQKINNSDNHSLTLTKNVLPDNQYLLTIISKNTPTTFKINF